MNRFTAMLWKEWHEARPYLWIGLGLFLGVPAVKCVQDTFHANRHLDFAASMWVIPLGGVLAVFVAVGVTTQDFRPRLADFWRSRPIHVTRWLAAKYAVALAVVLVACGLPLLIELALDRPDDTVAGSVLAFFPFYWTAIFSLAFLAGCVVGRPAHAATLGLAAMLLVYVAPIILPPLAWMNVGELFDARTADLAPWTLWLHVWGPREFRAAAGMVGLAVACGGVAVVAVRRAWRVESGRRTMYGLVAAAFLLLFASAAFQLETNLPVLQQVALPADERVESIHTDDTGIWVYTSRPYWKGAIVSGRNTPIVYLHRPVEVRPAGIVLGNPTVGTAGVVPPFDWTNPSRLKRGHVWYESVSSDSIATNTHIETISLQTWDADGGPLSTTRLWDQPFTLGNPALYLWRDTLYVYGDRMDVVDVSQPDRPRVLSDVPRIGAQLGPNRAVVRGDQMQIVLVRLPDLPPAGRLDATLPVVGLWYAFDGHTLCCWDGRDHTLVAYRLAHLDADTATFDLIGQYRPTLLQQWVNSFEYGPLTLSDGLLYVDGLGYTGTTFNSSVTILDTRGPRPMRAVGHFAAPGAQFVRPLPDGRALVGGQNTLWLVAMPRRR